MQATNPVRTTMYLSTRTLIRYQSRRRRRDGDSPAICQRQNKSWATAPYVQNIRFLWRSELMDFIFVVLFILPSRRRLTTRLEGNRLGSKGRVKIHRRNRVGRNRGGGPLLV
ncbi:hypothetical protein N658DRAFT_210835 [Parathielavia hyrcaniae]|uniref:Uncharacterized protein n=1 Tax=Parathielavia hyrcaniae TaxID=113614 RepID=A0AAN6PVN6_9PEZI|nr:hypothetical protein N658DRAFT_210835 [Parathielavia hyrcaniae]